ncbi:MAG: hypothetical protein OXG24_02580 [Gammaproteobacteria bacterium]|nr:hypothetical protein [Gammaproteobacteria bacterium]
MSSENRNRRSSKFQGLAHWFGLAVAIVLIGSFGTYYFWPNGDTPVGESLEPDKQLDDSVTKETPEQQFPPRKLRQAWYKTSGKDAKLIERPQDLPGDSSYVTLTGEYDQWLLGTPVEIAIPQIGKRYRSVVDRIAPDEFGNVTIHAKPDADEEEFLRLILTFNSAQTLAYVSTTSGSYELTGTETGGWITSTSSLQKKRDYSLKDVLETQRDRHANTKYVPPRED